MDWCRYGFARWNWDIKGHGRMAHLWSREKDVYIIKDRRKVPKNGRQFGSGVSRYFGAVWRLLPSILLGFVWESAVFVHVVEAG